MWKVFLIFFLITKSNSFDVVEYVKSIEESIKDEHFLKEYFEWSMKLFSDKEYLFGPQPGAFSCSVSSNKSQDDPIDVHHLRPQDVQCVAALGDSLTAGLGAHAATPIGLFTENRGLSWSIGGDKQYSELVTLPNILREYNPNLKGFSTKSSIIFLKGQNSSHNGLNVAKSGDKSYHTIDQVKILYERLKSNEFCHLQDDWKIVTFFVGGNDLCIFCEDLHKHSPKNFTSYIRDTLDFLFENFHRTFVNLVLVLDVRNVKKLNDGGNICKLLHRRTCPCAAFPTENDTEKLNHWFPLYHQNLIDLINSGRYDQPNRKDFTVVVQPFMAHTQLPLKDGQIDYSYFAPDCFHFSGKGHSRAALSLWNNMLEPVGEKKWEWFSGEKLECPTADRPYFATRLNSRQSNEKIPSI